MMQAGQNRHSDNGSVSLNRSTRRRILAQRQVSARFIVIAGVQQQNSPQVRLTEDQHPVQALATHGADQAFRIAILPGRSRRDWPVVDPHGSHARGKDLPVGTVIVAYQIRRRRCPGEGFGDLPGQPLCGRTPRWPLTGIRSLKNATDRSTHGHNGARRASILRPGQAATHHPFLDWPRRPCWGILSTATAHQPIPFPGSTKPRQGSKPSKIRDVIIEAAATSSSQ